jgi:hypothetical protein
MHLLVDLARKPTWRNWQTRRTQNPLSLKGRVGSTPSVGIVLRLKNAWIVETGAASVLCWMRSNFYYEGP